MPPTRHDRAYELDERGSGRPLPRSFFAQPTLTVARQLLGKILVHASPDGTTAGRIVEVEAYRGPRDRAAHSRGGHRSPRNESMYGPAGHAYVYLVYGLHHCLNVVTRAPGVPEAVLLRALEPIRGLSLMRTRRGGAAHPDWQLCRGPGVLCRSLGIDRTFDGRSLRGGRLRIVDAPGFAAPLIRRTARIGVDYAGPDAARPWRFLVAGVQAVSGKRIP